ncbi:hypothetical protein ACOMHN_060665 [Nucella lapillus]
MSDDEVDIDGAVVIDNGSDLVKAGFAGDDAPKTVFPTLPRHRKPPDVVAADLDRGTGNEADTEPRVKRDSPTLQHPMERGMITNWDDMEEVWRDTFKELHVASEDHPVLLSEPPFNPKPVQEKTAQIMFETFQVPALVLVVDAVLSLYSSGRTSGVLLDAGEGVTRAVPVSDNHCLPHAVTTLNLAGEDLTTYMAKMLAERGLGLAAPRDTEIGRAIKEKYCFVALDYEKDMQRARESSEFETNYELPDGQVITVGSERFRCPEAMFQPSLLGICEDSMGIHHLIHNSIMRCDTDIQK